MKTLLRVWTVVEHWLVIIIFFSMTIGAYVWHRIDALVL
jgi:hypothetical protein